MYPCLYTQRITQRQKKYKDGFVEINPNGNGIYKISIFNDEKRKVDTIKTSDIPILDGSDFQAGSYLIQIEPTIIVSSSKDVLPLKSNSFIESSNFSSSRHLPQKNYSNKINLSNNSNYLHKFEKKNECGRKLRDIPRTFEEIIEFYNIDVSIANSQKNLIQKNLNDYLDS